MATAGVDRRCAASRRPEASELAYGKSIGLTRPISELPTGAVCAATQRRGSGQSRRNSWGAGATTADRERARVEPLPRERQKGLDAPLNGAARLAECASAGDLSSSSARRAAWPGGIVCATSALPRRTLCALDRGLVAVCASRQPTSLTATTGFGVGGSSLARWGTTRTFSRVRTSWTPIWHAPCATSRSRIRSRRATTGATSAFGTQLTL